MKFSCFPVSLTGLLWALFVTLSSMCAPSALAQNEPNALASPFTLTPGQMIRSSNKQYKAIMQTDGNFVVYREQQAAVMQGGVFQPGLAIRNAPQPDVFVWATGTNGKGPISGIRMNGDGTLCVYTPAAAVWCNSGPATPGNYFAMLRDNGDLEVYRGTSANAANSQLTWTSGLDATYYSNRYADLKQAFRDDANQLRMHWITYGRYEGRSPRPGISDEGRQHALSVNLDTVFYANKYPDLKQTFGYDAERLYQHWMNSGRAEGRVHNKVTEEFLAAPPRSAQGLAYMRNADWLHTNEFMRSPGVASSPFCSLTSIW